MKFPPNKSLASTIACISETKVISPCTMPLNIAAYETLQPGNTKIIPVSVNLEIAGNLLKVNVTDNGIGLSTAASMEGSGMTNMKRRIKSLGGTLTISFDKGTTLNFNVPI